MSRRIPFEVHAVIGAVLAAPVIYFLVETSSVDDDPAPPTSDLTQTSAGQTTPGDAPSPVIEMPQPLHEAPGFGEALRAWLLDNPGILYEMAAKLDEERAVAAVANDRALIDAHHDALFADPRDGRIGGGHDGGGDPAGDPDAPTFVEFVDYNCGFCRRGHAEVKAFAAAHPDGVIVIKEFPILGPGSEAAARAVLAVKTLHGMRAYRAVHNAFLELEGQLDEAGIEALFAEFALDGDWDIAAIRAEMQSDAVTAQINDTRALAARLGITGTPGFVFHGSIGRGLMTLGQLEAAAGSIPEDEPEDNQ